MQGQDNARREGPVHGGAVGYVVRMEDGGGGDELPFEAEEIHIVEAWD
jgi:hypothetical protein